MYQDSHFVPTKATMGGTIAELFPDLVRQTSTDRMKSAGYYHGSSLLRAWFDHLATAPILTDEDSARISKSVTVVRRLLKIVLREEARALLLIGSHVRDTRLTRRLDANTSIDALVPFRTDLKSGPFQCMTVLQELIGTWLPDELSRTTPTGAIIDMQGHTLNLIPGQIARDGRLHMATLDEDRKLVWTPINPRQDLEALRSADARHGGLVSSVVRIAKAWNIHAGGPLPGYAIESAIARHTFRTSQQLGFMAMDAMAALPVPRGLADSERAKIVAMKGAALQAIRLERDRRFDDAHAVMRPHLPDSDFAEKLTDGTEQAKTPETAEG